MTIQNHCQAINKNRKKKWIVQEYIEGEETMKKKNPKQTEQKKITNTKKIRINPV